MQRHRGAAAAAAGPSSADDGHTVSDDESYQDDKQTRLTLMEEVLLLGLKDREVCDRIDVGDRPYGDRFDLVCYGIEVG